MGKEVRFIHAADLHLGSSLTAIGTMSPELQGKIRRAGYTALERVVDAVLKHKVDFVVFSGDIYDREAHSVYANQYFVEQMARLDKRGTPVFVIYGNHDPLGTGPEFFQLPPNVHIFGSEKVETREVKDQAGRLVARVLGQSYRNPSESRKMYQSFSTPDNHVVNVGLLHTGLNPSANSYVPCTLTDLTSQPGIDYWALGHIHRPSIRNKTRPVIAYPGIPQGRDQGEPGVGGCFLVTVQPGQPARVQFIPTSSVVWLTMEVPIDNTVVNVSDLEELILAHGQAVLNNALHVPCDLELGPGENLAFDGYVVRWVLTGRGKVHQEIISGNEPEVATLLTERLRQQLGRGRPFLWTETVRFKTAAPVPRLESLLKQDMVLKTLFETSEEIKSNAELRKQAVKAMGRVWFLQKDPEDTRPDAFAITDEVFKALVEKARYLVLERIVEGREIR